MKCAGPRAVVLLLLPFLVLSFPLGVLSADEQSAAAKGEIEHLLGYIEHAGCQFYRNGTWYSDTKAARDHVQKKYEYFAKKGKVNSAEDFIQWAASKSEMSGNPYMVRYGNGAPIPLARWLTDELARYRKSITSSPR